MSEDGQARSQSTRWGDALVTMFRLIFFRASPADLEKIGWRHFAIGLLCTWLVGMGRYWDNPRVGLLQHLGVGSVIYIFVLSLFLWLVIWPLRPRNWTYFNVLTFISLVSPPAVLYAIPVEKLVSLDTANAINAGVLALVAYWRVALLVFYLRRSGKLDWFATFVATLLPLTVIVVALTMLNLDKVVFDLMGGGGERSPNDSAYGILFFLSLVSVMLFIPLLICYLYLLVERLTTARYHVSDE
jgi:hypothetical protein